MKKSIFVMLVLVTLLGCKTEPPETTELNGATYELDGKTTLRQIELFLPVLTAVSKQAGGSIRRIGELQGRIANTRFGHQSLMIMLS